MTNRSKGVQQSGVLQTVKDLQLSLLLIQLSIKLVLLLQQRLSSLVWLEAACRLSIYLGDTSSPYGIVMAWLAIPLALLESKILMTTNSWSVLTCQKNGRVRHVPGLLKSSKKLVAPVSTGITSLQLKASN